MPSLPPSPGQEVLTGTTALALAQAIVGDGVTSVTGAQYVGHPDAAGVFSGMGPVTQVDSGVVLSSGSAAKMTGPYAAPNASTNHGQAGDAQLTALAGHPTHDAAVLEFDFVPDSTSVLFRYVFGSTEYPEYLFQRVNDVFALSVNGSNCALIPGTSEPVTIDTVNHLTNAQFYVANTGGYDTAMHGFTSLLSCEAAVDQGATNHIRLAIADTFDRLMDSWALIAMDSLVANTAPTVESYQVTTPAGVPVAVPLIGDDPEGQDLEFASGAPAHGSLGGTAPDLVYTPDPGFTGTDSFTYTASDGWLGSEPGTITVEVGATHATLVADPGRLVADGATTADVTLRIEDEHAQPVAGRDVLLTTDAGSIGATVDNGDGTYAAVLTSSTTAEIATLRAQIDGAATDLAATVEFVRASLQLEHPVRTVGAAQVATGEDFLPHEPVSVELGDLPLGEGVADAAGTVVFPFDVPEVPDAMYEVTMTGLESAQAPTAAFEVVSSGAPAPSPVPDAGAGPGAGDGPLAVTGAPVALAAGAAGVLVAAGAAVLGLRHRARRARG
ncbi:choice-of-anchor L domain-containing protein [Cellulomonas sp. Marseille-Q8402]